MIPFCITLKVSFNTNKGESLKILLILSQSIHYLYHHAVIISFKSNTKSSKDSNSFKWRAKNEINTSLFGRINLCISSS
jgi:hypothetical protein